jgi:hypothetical protein
MKIGDKTDWTLWCNECCNRDVMEILLITKGKTGSYRPYRDTLEYEPYHYTELKVKCLHCGTEQKAETDEHYTLSKTPMEEYGYRGANYGT